MYKEFEGQKVTIFTSTRGSTPLRYEGTLKKADHILILENVTIYALARQVASNVFDRGSSFMTFEQDLQKVGINEDYVIPVNVNQ